MNLRDTYDLIQYITNKVEFENSVSVTASRDELRFRIVCMDPGLTSMGIIIHAEKFDLAEVIIEHYTRKLNKQMRQRKTNEH